MHSRNKTFLVKMNIVFNREGSENFVELVSLNNQADEKRIQEKLGKQIFDGNKKMI